MNKLELSNPIDRHTAALTLISARMDVKHTPHAIYQRLFVTTSRQAIAAHSCGMTDDQESLERIAYAAWWARHDAMPVRR